MSDKKKKKLLTINHTFWSQIKSRMDKEYSNMKDRHKNEFLQ